MKYFFLLLILASCTIDNSQEELPTPKKWEYELDIYDDKSALCQGNLTIPEELSMQELDELLWDLRRNQLKALKRLRLFVFIESIDKDNYSAIARFDPNLTIEYRYITQEQLKELKDYSFSSNEADEIIGEWIVGINIYTIYQKDKQFKLLAKTIFGEITREIELLQESTTNYSDLKEPEVHFMILENGNLSLYDEDFPEEEYDEIQTLKSFINDNT